jgi:heme exporter protein D
MPLALFGIDNDALNLTVNLLVLFLVVVWLALIAWTFFDARRRLNDQILVWCSVGASLFPFIGTIVYSILRPPEFLDDRRERELEIRAAELRVRQLSEQSCPKCEYPLEKGFLRCPNCQSRVKDPCPSCREPIDPRWSMCPYCETPLRREAAPRRGRPPVRSEPPPARKRPPERRPRAEKREPARSPQSQDKRPAERAAPKRTKRPAAERERARAASSNRPRRSSAKAVKGKSTVDEPTVEHRIEDEPGDEPPPRPAPAS